MLLKAGSDLLEPATDDGDGLATPLAVLADDQRVRDFLEARDEEALLAPYPVEDTVAEVAEVEEQQPALDARAIRNVCRSFVRSPVTDWRLSPVTLMTAWSLSAAFVWFVRQAG